MLTKTKLVLAAALVAGFASASVAEEITDATRYGTTNATPYGNTYFGSAYGSVAQPERFGGRGMMFRQAPAQSWFEQNWFNRASEGPVG